MTSRLRACRRARRSRRVRARPRGGSADRVDAPRGVSRRCGSWRRAARRSTSPARCGFPSRRSAPTAVELFLERARAARPGFEPDAEAVALAAEIARRVDGLPLAIELAAARVNVLGLAELVSILERRAALLRDSPASDPSRTALQGLVEWSYDLLHGDEKTLLQQLAVHRGGASLAVARRGRSDARPQRGDRRVSRLARWSTSRSCRPRSRAAPPATTCSTPSASTCSSVSPRAAGSPPPAAPTPSTSRRWPTRRASSCAGRNGCAGNAAWSWRTTISGLRSRTRATRPTLRVAVRLGTLGWYFALAERVSEGRRFLELALAATGDDAPVELRIELLADLCYLATEELDLDAALAAGERALSLAATAGGAAAARARAADARARPRAVRRRRNGPPRWRSDAGATLEAAGDDWGVAASSLIRAIGAAHAGDVSTVAAMAATVRRHSDAIGYDAFRVPGLLLEAWVAERRQDGAAAVEAYRRALELAARVGFGDHAAFALCRARLERARERRPARGRGAPAAGARGRRGGPRAVGRGPRARPARAHRRGGRRRGRRRAAVPRGPRVVAGCSGRTRRARASSSRSPAARRHALGCELRGSRRRRGRSARARPRSPELAEAPPRLAERWQRRRRAFVPSENRRTGGSNMSTTTIEDQLAEIRRRIDRLQALAQAGRRGERADPAPPRRTAPGGGIRPGRGARGSRRGRGEARAAEDEARRRRALAGRRRLRRLGDVRGRRRGRSSAAGTPTSSGCRRRPRRGRGRRASRPRRRSATSAAAGSRSTTASRRRATHAAAPGTSRGTASARLATSSNRRPTNCRRTLK